MLSVLIDLLTNIVITSYYYIARSYKKNLMFVTLTYYPEMFKTFYQVIFHYLQIVLEFLPEFGR